MRSASAVPRLASSLYQFVQTRATSALSVHGSLYGLGNPAKSSIAYSRENMERSRQAKAVSANQPLYFMTNKMQRYMGCDLIMHRPSPTLGDRFTFHKRQ